MITPSDIHPTTLVARLLDPDRRRELFTAMTREGGSRLPLTRAYGEAARLARATPDELRRIVLVLAADDLQDWIDDFIFHPQRPEDVLLDLCERGVCISALGHRAGPRHLLQRVVELHAYPEAIVSLALDLYRDPSARVADFTAFARAHSTHEWMLRTLAEVDGSDEEKEQVYENLLTGSPDAEAFHARYLARTERVPMERLAGYLARHLDPWVLTLLLRSEIENPEKRALVMRLAEARCDSPVIAETLALRRACDAAAAELTPETAAELFAAGVPEVLLALAGNPRTPHAFLDRLVQHRAAAWRERSACARGRRSNGGGAGEHPRYGRSSRKLALPPWQPVDRGRGPRASLHLRPCPSPRRLRDPPRRARGALRPPVPTGSRLMGHAPKSVTAKHYTAEQIETGRPAIEKIALRWVPPSALVAEPPKPAPPIRLTMRIERGAPGAGRTHDLRFRKGPSPAPPLCREWTRSERQAIGVHREHRSGGQHQSGVNGLHCAD